MSQLHGALLNYFLLTISATQVHKALLSLDCKKYGIPDKIETYVLKISEPIASIFNLSLPSNVIWLWSSCF